MHEGYVEVFDRVTLIILKLFGKFQFVKFSLQQTERMRGNNRAKKVISNDSGEESKTNR